MTSSKTQGKYWNLNLESKYICWVLFAIYFISLAKKIFLKICILDRINVHKVIYKTIYLCEFFWHFQTLVYLYFRCHSVSVINKKNPRSHRPTKAHIFQPNRWSSPSSRRYRNMYREHACITSTQRPTLSLHLPRSTDFLNRFPQPPSTPSPSQCALDSPVVAITRQRNNHH